MAITKNDKKTYGLIALIIAVMLLITYGGALNGSQTAREATTTGVQITSFTDLGGQTLQSGSTYPIKINVKNLGSTPFNGYVQAAFYSTDILKDIGFQAVASSSFNLVPSCVAAEEFTSAAKINNLGSGQTIEVTVIPKAPNPNSKVGDAQDLSNWGSKFIEHIGVYDLCYKDGGKGYLTQATAGNIKISEQPTVVTVQPSSSTPSTPTTPKQAESCVITRDCSLWVLGDVECTNGQCLEKAKTPVTFPDPEQWIKDHPYIMWGVIILLFLVAVIWFFSEPKQRS